MLTRKQWRRCRLRQLRNRRRDYLPGGRNGRADVAARISSRDSVPYRFFARCTTVRPVSASTNCTLRWPGRMRVYFSGAYSSERLIVDIRFARGPRASSRGTIGASIGLPRFLRIRSRDFARFFSAHVAQRSAVCPGSAVLLPMHPIQRPARRRRAARSVQFLRLRSVVFMRHPAARARDPKRIARKTLRK